MRKAEKTDGNKNDSTHPIMILKLFDGVSSQKK